MKLIVAIWMGLAGVGFAADDLPADVVLKGITGLTLDHKQDFVGNQIDGFFFKAKPEGQLVAFVIHGYAANRPVFAIYLSRTWENKDSALLAHGSTEQEQLLELLAKADVGTEAKQGDVGQLEEDVKKERTPR